MSQKEEEELTYSSKYNVYSEKLWTRDDGQIDGYSFRGKRSFGKALEGLKSIMVKGEQKEIEGVKYTSKDKRIQGPGLEIIIEVQANKSRGVAILKVYGPKEDIKKENSVTITKSKQSDSKYVVILAEKVIKPLMNGFLSGEIEVPQSEKRQSSLRRLKHFKCSFCDKTCKTQAGLKNHIRRMHLDVKQLVEENVQEESCSKKRKVEVEVMEFVDSVIDGVFNADIEATIKESKKELVEEKKYAKICNSCDFKVEANKNYISVQKILQHRDICSLKTKCDQCELKFKGNEEMKKHMRDAHQLISSSTSPPLKKKKVEKRMVPPTDSAPQQNIINFSDDQEEMEIDNDFIEDDILMKRSRMMDEKVLAQQRKYDREMKEFLGKQEALKIKESGKKQSKSKKSQKTKLGKYEKNTNKEYPVVNIKEVPDNCKSLVNEGDLVYVVPGDGACGPNSAAAHLFQDEVFGPKLRGKMNAFFAKHFYKKYQYKTPCSVETPFRRKVGSKMVVFDDPEKLINWLKSSNEAIYMWSDSEDLVIIADMYQMCIKIITSRGENDEKPTVNWIYPDKDLEEEAELRNVEIKDMVLFHENDLHFNLVVAKDSDLATMGSISYRQNIGAMVRSKTTDVKETKALNDGDDTQNKALKKELKETIENKNKFEKLYNECVKALREKCVENEKLKIEIKDLKETIEIDNEECVYERKTERDLKSHINENHDPSNFNCIKRNSRSKIKSNNVSHVDEHVDEKEFNCNGCDFQATTQLQLNKHTNLKHRTKEQMTDEVIKCKHCDDQFSDIWSLMNHRKLKHAHLVAQCKSITLNGKCRFTSEKCWWSHDTKKTDHNLAIKCFICDKSFTSKSEMMKHRKREHRSKVRKCTNFTQNQCPFVSESCWFLHEEDVNTGIELESKEDEKEVQNDDVDKSTFEPVFQKVTENLEPPISNRGK